MALCLKFIIIEILYKARDNLDKYKGYERKKARRVAYTGVFRQKLNCLVDKYYIYIITVIIQFRIVDRPHAE